MYWLFHQLLEKVKLIKKKSWFGLFFKALRKLEIWHTELRCLVVAGSCCVRWGWDCSMLGTVSSSELQSEQGRAGPSSQPGSPGEGGAQHAAARGEGSRVRNHPVALGGEQEKGSRHLSRPCMQPVERSTAKQTWLEYKTIVLAILLLCYCFNFVYLLIVEKLLKLLELQAEGKLPCKENANYEQSTKNKNKNKKIAGFIFFFLKNTRMVVYSQHNCSCYIQSV